jgi:putative SOS response-associated peptidase YedK
VSNLEPRYNVCPTQAIHAVIERDARRELVPMRWGLVPAWWKKMARETPKKPKPGARQTVLLLLVIAILLGLVTSEMFRRFM